MEFFIDFAQFALRTVFIAASVTIVATLLFQISSRSRTRSHLEVEKLNSRFRSFRRHLQSHLLGRKQFKNLVKTEKKADKKDRKQELRRLYVLDFDGDIRATEVQNLREEITAVLLVADPTRDEVVVRLESGGGLVSSYGLGASQLKRISDAGIRLSVCVDKIAASGGYMMACTADRIYAAPFAIVGSIGVIAQVPNFNKVLKKHDIDYQEVTAGEFKRTVTILGEITPPKLDKFKEQIEATHTLFKKFVKARRPNIELARVATGEHWYGEEALELGLVDEILTSDDFLFQRYSECEVFKVRYLARKKLLDRLSEAATHFADRSLTKLWGKIHRSRIEV